METNLINFMEKTKIINKELVEYRDEEKGIKFIFNTPYLLTRVDYMEVGIEKDKKYKISEYDKLVFEKQIEKLDYKEISKKVVKPKSEITGNKIDATTLIEEEQKAYAVWKVSNNVGTFTNFTTKEEAMKVSDEINNKILKELGVENV